MGVLPLQFGKGENADTLGIKGDETFDIPGISNLEPAGELQVVIKDVGKEKYFNVTARLDAPIELEYYRNGGILHKFLRNMLF